MAGAKYLHALEDGEIPLHPVVLGDRVHHGATAVASRLEPVAWNLEAAYRLPVSVWRGVMDLYFPNSGWVRVSRETLDRLQRFKAAQAVPTWDQAFEVLARSRPGRSGP